MGEEGKEVRKTESLREALARMLGEWNTNIRETREATTIHYRNIPGKSLVARAERINAEAVNLVGFLIPEKLTGFLHDRLLPKASKPAE
jgi:hypothetical protein